MLALFDQLVRKNIHALNKLCTELSGDLCLLALFSLSSALRKGSHLLSLLLECLLHFIDFRSILVQLRLKCVFLSLEASDALASCIVLVKSMRQFLSSLLQILLQLVHFKHLCVPLLLEEFEHAGEAHGLKRFWCSVTGDFEFNQIG